MREQEFIVKSNIQIANNIYELTLQGEILENIVAGQFANVSVANRADLILKRPLGIVRWGKDFFTVCYQVVGVGTSAMTALKNEDTVSVTYPLGNGFSVDNKKKIMLVAGGAGAFPILAAAEHLQGDIYTFLGFGSESQSVYIDDFGAVSKEMFVSSDDGSLGKKGFITDTIAAEIDRINPDIILSCGPIPMYKALKRVLSGYNSIPCFVSLEERMGCGVGACLVCVCKIKTENGVHHKRVCADGPVFNIDEVEGL